MNNEYKKDLQERNQKLKELISEAENEKNKLEEELKQLKQHPSYDFTGQLVSTQKPQSLVFEDVNGEIEINMEHIRFVLQLYSFFNSIRNSLWTIKMISMLKKLKNAYIYSKVLIMKLSMSIANL